MKRLSRGPGRWLLACVVAGAAAGCLNPRPEELPSADSLQPSRPDSANPGAQPETPPGLGIGPTTGGDGEALPDVDAEPNGDEGAAIPADAGAGALGVGGRTLSTDEPEPAEGADAGGPTDAGCAP